MGETTRKRMVVKLQEPLARGFIMQKKIDISNSANRQYKRIYYYVKLFA